GRLSSSATVGLQTLGSPKFRRKFIEQELLEVSAVAIPANPNALTLGLKSGAIEKSDLRDTLDLLQIALENPNAARVSPSPGGEGRGEGERLSSDRQKLSTAVPNTHAGASGVRGDEARLIQLARAVRDAIKEK